MPEMVYHKTTIIALKIINLQHNLVIGYMKLGIEFVNFSRIEDLQVESNNWNCPVGRV